MRSVTVTNKNIEYKNILMYVDISKSIENRGSYSITFTNGRSGWYKIELVGGGGGGKALRRGGGEGVGAHELREALGGRVRRRFEGLL